MSDHGAAFLEELVELREVLAARIDRERAELDNIEELIAGIRRFEVTRLAATPGDGPAQDDALFSGPTSMNGNGHGPTPGPGTRPARGSGPRRIRPAGQERSRRPPPAEQAPAVRAGEVMRDRIRRAVADQPAKPSWTIGEMAELLARPEERDPPRAGEAQGRPKKVFRELVRKRMNSLAEEGELVNRRHGDYEVAKRTAREAV